MTRLQLVRAVARATGEDIAFIGHRGFSVVQDRPSICQGDWEALIADWDQIRTEQSTAVFAERQTPRPS